MTALDHERGMLDHAIVADDQPRTVEDDRAR
jgi:hypothetical protein